jgi:hypothetical protein
MILICNKGQRRAGNKRDTSLQTFFFKRVSLYVCNPHHYKTKHREFQRKEFTLLFYATQWKESVTLNETALHLPQMHNDSSLICV